jgi:hypothetical protein
LENSSVLCVDGVQNTEWLLWRLSHSFVFQTSEPMATAHNSSDCIFRVAQTAQTSGVQFERLLARIPEVQLILETVASPDR